LLFACVGCGDTRQRMLIVQETINTPVSDSITARNMLFPL
jgi:hypothetical protein